MSYVRLIPAYALMAGLALGMYHGDADGCGLLTRAAKSAGGLLIRCLGAWPLAHFGKNSDYSNQHGAALDKASAACFTFNETHSQER